MTPTPPAPVLDRVVSKVLAYQTGAFVLRADLDRLVKVHQVEALEAVILYCSRILEVLTAAALEVKGLPVSGNPFGNLDLLQQFNLIPPSTRYCAHALRRLGNAARHIHCTIGPDDAELAVLFAERTLEWVFLQISLAGPLTSLTHDGQPLGLSPSQDLRDVLARFDVPDFNPCVLVAPSVAALSPNLLRRTPVLPALLAESLMDRGELESANRILDEALQPNQFGEDLRLRQLKGLYYSRKGLLREAIDCLEPLYSPDRDDDETSGILAGVYKRFWQKDKRKSEWLEKSWAAYLNGWKQSKKTIPYLGINAATTGLWLGRLPEARQAAFEVRAVLQKRAQALRPHDEDAHLVFNYWDQATLAEAELLLGDLAMARRHYHAAFTRHPDQAANIDVTKKQAKEILATWRLSPQVIRTFVDQQPVPQEEWPLPIGIVGQPGLTVETGFRDRILQVLGEARKAAGLNPPRRLVAVSMLADAVERFAAEALLDGQYRGTLHIVLPVELADYRASWFSEASWPAFQSLLDRADAITLYPAPPEKKRKVATSSESGGAENPTAASERCAQQIVDHSSMLLALWDASQPASGKGFLARITSHARSRGRPVIWLSTTPPFEARWEGIDQIKPCPLNTAGVVLPEAVVQLTEKLAENAHDHWAVMRMKEGWTYGLVRDDKRKKHPCLVPYAELPESEKEYDRQAAMETLKAILALGYRLEEK